MVRDVRPYDVIVFGDEVPGVLAAISAAREYRRRTRLYPRVLLMSKGNLQEGLGGHLVRGGLSYLDRSQIDQSIRTALGLDTFGDPASIYKEFLRRAGVSIIGLDPRRASTALQDMRREAGVDLLGDVDIASVTKEGQKLVRITTTKGERFSAKQFIDATVNAELAQAAGVNKLLGFGTFGLPESELPVTLTFETQGLTPRRLKELDFTYNRRFTNLADTEAQRFLLAAAGGDRQLADVLRRDMIDERGNLKTLWAGTDYIDVRSPALSVSYHSFRGKKLAFPATDAVLDKANIAILPGDRLSWNALLCAVNGSEAEALARGDSKPTPKMLQEIIYIEKWLKSLGATAVKPASELYIRHAGNVTGVVDPLTGAEMLMGGVPVTEALATFAYHFDVRGGIPGLGSRATSLGWTQGLTFAPPLFNIGIQHAISKDVPNLAIVSPASGFVGFAPSAGRIVEFNVAVGQGLGIAAIIALLGNRNLADITNREVRQVLVETGQLPRVFGTPKLAEAARLDSFENLVAIA